MQRSILFKMLTIVVSAGLAVPAAAAPSQKLILAVQPTLSTSEIIEKSKPLEEALEKELGDVDVQIYAPMSYAAAVEALRFGHAHAALMGAWPARLAHRLAGAEIPLAEVREVLHGEEKVNANYYYSYWIVMKDNAAQKLKDLKGRDVCFSSPTSTSGYVAPLGRMVELGLVVRETGSEADAGDFFSNVLFGGSYQQCWTALKNGQVDVTIIAGDVPEKLYREVLASTRVIEEQGPIPSHALAVSPALEEPLRTKLIEALEKVGSEDRDLMRGFISGIFVGFQKTTAEEHLKGLDQYLDESGLQYTERLG